MTTKRAGRVRQGRSAWGETRYEQYHREGRRRGGKMQRRGKGWRAVLMEGGRLGDGVKTFINIYRHALKELASFCSTEVQ